MKKPEGSRTSAAIAVLLASLVVVMALTLGACGGGSGSATTATPTSAPPALGSSTGTPAGGASPVATPTTTAEVTAAYFDALSKVENIIGFRRLVGLYAEDARFEDRAMGVEAVGAKAIADYWNTYFLAGPLKDKPFSRLVGGDSAVVEEVASAGGQVYGADVLRMRGGKIVTDFIYYNDTGAISRFPPVPLKTPPAQADTQAASQKLADVYMSALRALAPARLAALYAGHVVYQDTARDRRYVGPSAAVAAHAQMFALEGVSFQAMGVAAGPGWAAVMWKRTDREGGKPLVDIPDQYTKWARRPTIHGVSILEIRRGEIARETVYSDHLRTRY
jgi:hypothetical protein